MNRIIISTVIMSQILLSACISNGYEPKKNYLVNQIVCQFNPEMDAVKVGINKQSIVLIPNEKFNLSEEMISAQLEKNPINSIVINNCSILNKKNSKDIITCLKTLTSKDFIFSNKSNTNKTSTSLPEYNKLIEILKYNADKTNSDEILIAFVNDYHENESDETFELAKGDSYEGSKWPSLIGTRTRKTSVGIIECIVYNNKLNLITNHINSIETITYTYDTSANYSANIAAINSENRLRHRENQRRRRYEDKVKRDEEREKQNSKDENATAELIIGVADIFLSDSGKSLPEIKSYDFENDSYANLKDLEKATLLQTLNAALKKRESLITTDGKTISGDTANGFGEFQFTNSSIYKGYWKSNKADGEGEITYPNGSYFKGFFINGFASGECHYENSSHVYKGNFINGYMHGRVYKIPKNAYYGKKPLTISSIQILTLINGAIISEFNPDQKIFDEFLSKYKNNK